MIFNVQGRPAMALRAIPFVSGGLIDTTSICLYTVDHKLNPYWPKITPFRLDEHGLAVEIPLALLSRMRPEMDDVVLHGGTIQDLRNCIPPGVYAWESEVFAACSVYSINRSRWSTSPIVTKEELAFVLEAGPAVAGPWHAPKRLGTSEFDPEIQQRADQARIELASKLKRAPTKSEIANELIRNGMHCNASTLIRRFRVSRGAAAAALRAKTMT